jgi:hypothetical protein
MSSTLFFLYVFLTGDFMGLRGQPAPVRASLLPDDEQIRIESIRPGAMPGDTGIGRSREDADSTVEMRGHIKNLTCNLSSGCRIVLHWSLSAPPVLDFYADNVNLFGKSTGMKGRFLESRDQHALIMQFRGSFEHTSEDMGSEYEGERFAYETDCEITLVVTESGAEIVYRIAPYPGIEMQQYGTGLLHYTERTW